MDRKTTNIVAYLTWVGLIIAYVMGDRNASHFHLNQSLVIWLVGTVGGFIPLVNLVTGIFCLICWVLGLIYAVEQVEKEVPIIGRIKLLH